MVLPVVVLELNVMDVGFPPESEAMFCTQLKDVTGVDVPVAAAT